jgi:hypothetical protein
VTTDATRRHTTPHNATRPMRSNEMKRTKPHSLSCAHVCLVFMLDPFLHAVSVSIPFRYNSNSNINSKEYFQNVVASRASDGYVKDMSSMSCT